MTWRLSAVFLVVAAVFSGCSTSTPARTPKRPPDLIGSWAAVNSQKAMLLEFQHNGKMIVKDTDTHEPLVYRYAIVGERIPLNVHVTQSETSNRVSLHLFIYQEGEGTLFVSTSLEAVMNESCRNKAGDNTVLFEEGTSCVKFSRVSDSTTNE